MKVNDKFDVVVVGGGIAGISAALSARRSGVKVLLIEKNYLLGGLATAGLITIYLPLCDGCGNQVSFGIAEELLRLSVKYGNEGMDADVWLNANADKTEREKTRFQTEFNANLFAILCEQHLIDEGVELLYGTLVCDLQQNSNNVNYIIVENKNGRTAYGAKAFVDATGDADLFRFAGCKTELYKRGNVLASWYYELTDGVYGLRPVGQDYKMPIESNRYKQKHYSGVDAKEVSDFVILSHNEILLDFLKKGGINKNHALCTIPTIPQIRMSRRIQGEYTLDDTESGKFFHDSIGLIGDWRVKGPVYEIPFGILHGKIRNLFTCGRSVSVTDNMWDVIRVIPACAVTGQAAGTATAFLKNDSKSVDVFELQKKLKTAGVKIHISDIFL